MLPLKSRFSPKAPWSRLSDYSRSQIRLGLYLLFRLILSFFKVLFSLILANIFASLVVHIAGAETVVTTLMEDLNDPQISFAAVTLLFMELINRLTVDKASDRLLIPAGFLFFTAGILLSSGSVLREVVEPYLPEVKTSLTADQVNVFMLMATSSYLAICEVARLKRISDDFTNNIRDISDEELKNFFPSKIVKALSVIRYHNRFRRYINMFNSEFDKLKESITN